MDLEIDFTDGISLRRQLEDALRVAIRCGRLSPGSVLPPSRDLAEWKPSTWSSAARRRKG